MDIVAVKDSCIADIFSSAPAKLSNGAAVRES